LGIGKLAAILLDDHASAAMKIARARVIAQPLPGMEHLIEVGRGQILHCRPAGKKIAKVRTDGRDRRLLQHDLAEPDMIRVGALAGLRPPGQAPAVAVIPGEELEGAAHRYQSYSRRAM